MTPDCLRCGSPLEPSDLRCAVCGLATPAASSAGPVEAVAETLRCHGCGAAVVYDPAIGAPRCDFCGSVMEVEAPEDPIERAVRFVRFGVDDATARASLRAWLGRRGFFRPADLGTAAAVEQLRPLWWVAWLFDVDARVSWAADSDAGARRSSWAPHAGQVDLSLRRVLVPASRGLTVAECEELGVAYDLSSAAAEPEGHPGATVEQFSVQRSAARQIVARALERAAAAEVRPQVPGSACRNLKVAVLPNRLRTVGYGLPAYVLAYRYGDRLYRAIVHGQDPRVVLGEMPWSIGRIALVVAIVVITIAIVAVLAWRFG